MAGMTRFHIEPAYACLSCMRQVPSFEVWQRHTERGLVFTHHAADGHPVVRIVFREQQAQAPPASDPPGLVTLVDKHIDGLRRAYSHDGIDVAMREMGKIRIEALEGFRDTLLPASPQAETKRDCTCLGSCRGAEGLSPRYRCVLASPQAETTKGDE